MKTFILILGATLLMATPVSAQQLFTLNATIKDPQMTGHKAYLVDPTTNQNLDSTTVSASGTLVFKGNVAEPQMMQVVIGDRYATNFIAESGSINMIAGEVDSLWGAPLNNAYQQYYTAVLLPQQSLQKVFATIETQEQYDSIMKTVFLPYQTSALEQTKVFYEQNKENLIGGILLDFRLQNSNCSLPALDSVLAQAGEPVKANKGVKNKLAELRGKENTAVGKKFADFEAQLLDGTAAKLSDFVGKGKFVLVDFWASWCGPCRGEVPNVANIHQKYDDKVTVLGVNVWDKKDKALPTIKELNMSWPQIIVEGDGATQAYGIRGIPTLILFAPDGTIVNRTLRGEDIEPVVKSEIAK